MFGIVGAHADDELTAEQTTNFADGQIALSQMHAMGAGGERDVRAVVHDHCDLAVGLIVGLVSYLLNDMLGVLEERSGVHVLLADLDAIDAGLQCLTENLRPRVPTEGLGQKQADTPLAGGSRLQGGVEILFEFVGAVAELLDRGGIDAGDGLAEFFEAAQGFAESFARGNGDVGHAAALGFGRCGDGRADIAGCIADGGEGGLIADGGAQFVAKMFGAFGEVGAIQNEAGGIFKRPQCFAGAVGIGVDEAMDRRHGATIVHFSGEHVRFAPYES